MKSNLSDRDAGAFGKIASRRRSLILRVLSSPSEEPIGPKQLLGFKSLLLHHAHVDHSNRLS
jgi:hypothetical protein